MASFVSLDEIQHKCQHKYLILFCAHFYFHLYTETTEQIIVLVGKIFAALSNYLQLLAAHRCSSDGTRFLC